MQQNRPWSHLAKLQYQQQFYHNQTCLRWIHVLHWKLCCWFWHRWVTNFLTEMVKVIAMEGTMSHTWLHITRDYLMPEVFLLHCYGKIDVISHQIPHSHVMMQYNMRKLYYITGTMLYHHEEHTQQVSKDDWLVPEASFGLWVLSLPASVCVSVCVSLCGNHLLVRAITWDPFKLGSPNLDQRCKRPWLRSLLFWGAIDLDLQGEI